MHAIVKQEENRLKCNSPYEEARICEGLRVNLRNEILTYIHRAITDKICLYYDDIPQWFFHELMSLLEPSYFGANDHIVRRGEVPTQLYLVVEGDAEEIREVPNDYEGPECVAIYPPGSLIYVALRCALRRTEEGMPTPTDSYVRACEPTCVFVLETLQVEEKSRLDPVLRELLLEQVVRAVDEQERDMLLSDQARERTLLLRSKEEQAILASCKPCWVTLAEADI